MTAWAELTVDERKMLHMVYDHAPETPWQDVFLRFQMAHLTKPTRLLHGVVPYAQYRMPAGEREEFCKRLVPKLVELGLVFPEGKAERRGSVSYSGKGARLTDQGWGCLGSPGSRGTAVDFESHVEPRSSRVSKDTTECLGCGKPMPVTNETFGFAVCSASCKEKRLKAVLGWMSG